MSYRCEDAPACGCGPEGCVDRSRTVNCADCGRSFHPDGNTETYCYRCAMTPARPKFDGTVVLGEGKCGYCEKEFVERRRWRRDSNQETDDMALFCRECYEIFEEAEIESYERRMHGDE